MLSFDMFLHLHSTGKAARRNAQREKHTKEGTEQREGNEREGRDMSCGSICTAHLSFSIEKYVQQ